MPLTSFGAPLELSWAPVGLTGPSLGALWDSQRGFGWVLSFRCGVAKVCVLEHLGTARAPLYCFRGVFCAREASSWVPWAAPDAFVGVPWSSLGALSVLFFCFWETSRCRPCFCAIWGGARCAIRTCRCMSCKGSPSQQRLPFDTLLRQPDGYDRGQEGLRGTQSGTRDARQLKKWCARPL